MRFAIPLIALAAVSACSSDTAMLNGSDDASFDMEADTDTDADTDADADADADWDTDAPPPPPEEEDNEFFLRPATTDAYVFVANPDRDTVTRVTVDTREVRTIDVGNDPRLVLTSPDYLWAVSFNRGDNSVSLINTNMLTVDTVPVRNNFNAMVMSPDGLWVALWHDIAAESPDDPPPTGSVSFNEVSFVNVLTGEHFPMAVEYNPRNIRFTPDSRTAIVVSDSALAKVDLLASVLLPTIIPVVDGDDLDPPVAEEIALAPDGSYALVRQFGATDIVVVDLLAETVDYVPIAANPTDLDLNPAGTKAVVVARDVGTLLSFDMQDPFALPEEIQLPSELTTPMGQLLFTPDGGEGVLFTTASPTNKYVTWDPATNETEIHALVKPVKSMAVTPTGDTILAVHTLEDDPTASLSPFTGEYALSMIDRANHVDFPLLLQGEPSGFANASNGLRGYFIMEGVNVMEVLDYRTRLHEDIPLGSPPVFVGVLPDLDPADNDEPAAWVSQDHALGRMTFYDPDDGFTQTITGFELNSAIEGQ